MLSPATEAFDRGKKFARDRRINSLMDDVLIAPDQMRAEQDVRREDKAWTLTELISRASGCLCGAMIANCH